MRKCIDEGTLQAWFDGELDANAGADVAAHLHGCIHCGEAAGTLEVENLILSQGLAAEFVEAVPTERLRQRVKSAAASELPVTNGPAINGSWVNAVRNLLPSFRAVAYASIAAAILIAGILLAVNLRKERPAPSVEIVKPTEVIVPTPQTTTPEPPQEAVASGPSRKPAPRRPKPSRSRRTSEPDAMSLAWQENQYQKAFSQLTEAIKAQAPLRPSLQFEYEYNLAMIDNAIISARQGARKNPKDPLAAQSMLAAYQSKIDLMNGLVQGRVSEP
ncbi:MAG TPA: hypothetical protein VFX97_08460 [Pyrinomonadaceae bacterium]|nr:hypothetical protein [Pyrinomonadaceae bacterium]